MMSPEHLGRLMDEHSAALVLYARQWCTAPEDIVQEAFLKLVAQKTPPDKPVPWLYRVVRNEAVNVFRANQRRRIHETAAATRAATWFEPSPSARLDGEDATRALEVLPLEQRETIVAHLWGGLTFEQIGALTGVSSSTAHRWYIAGLSSLRERLEIPCPKPTGTRT
jgi:RNA polymerase sigma-70 factor (ECF subfamily)